MTTVGQLLMTGVEGTGVTRETELFLKETGAGGVILFARNYESPKQLAAFIRDLRQAAERCAIALMRQTRHRRFVNKARRPRRDSNARHPT